MPPPRKISETGILQKTKALYKLWLLTVPHISKSSRYTLGAKIDRLIIDIIEQSQIALYLPKDKKMEHISFAITKNDLLKTFLTIAWENNIISVGQYEHLSNSILEIGRMLGGWQRGLQNKTPEK